MKRTLFFLFSIIIACNLYAQQADLQKAVSIYKNHASITAQVTRSKHKAAVKKDVTDHGSLSMKRPDKVAITVNGGKDQLIMNGSTFTLINNKRKRVTSSKTNPQFVSFQYVFEYILSGGEKGGLNQLKDLTIKKSGTNFVLTITSQATTKKQKRRMMFTSFVLTLNARSGELKSLRMNQKGGNYTEYTFSDFSFN